LRQRDRSPLVIAGLAIAARVRATAIADPAIHQTASNMLLMDARVEPAHDE
jgi:hypothetical protein